MSNVSAVIESMSALTVDNAKAAVFFKDDGCMVLDLEKEDHKVFLDLLLKKNIKPELFDNITQAKEYQANFTQKLSEVANAKANVQNNIKPAKAHKEQAAQPTPAASTRPTITISETGTKITPPESFSQAEDKEWFKLAADMASKAKSNKAFAAAVMAVSAAIVDKKLHGLDTYSC